MVSMTRDKTDAKSLLVRVYGIVQGVGFRPFVSRAADSSGVATVMRRVTRELVSASEGMTSVCPGRSSTSS